MNVFVTGGTGFIGVPLVRALLQRGWEVTALVRQSASEGARAIKFAGARLVAGDITQRAALKSAMQGADVVINNAGWYELGLSGKRKAEMKSINVLGAENVLGTAVELGVPRIVHVSSIMAHGRTDDEVVDETYQRKYPPFTTYEETKTEAHEIALRYQRQGAPVMIASPGGVIGPGDHSPLGYLARLFIRGMFIPLGPNGSRSTVHVEDCAEGIALVAEKGREGEEYILSGGVQSYPEMFEVWKCVPGGPRFVIWLPRGIGVVSSAMTEPLERLFGLPPVITRESFITGLAHLNYSGAKAMRELGAAMRDPRQAWLDTLQGERQRAMSGKGWRDISV